MLIIFLLFHRCAGIVVLQKGMRWAMPTRAARTHGTLPGENRVVVLRRIIIFSSIYFIFTFVPGCMARKGCFYASTRLRYLIKSFWREKEESISISIPLPMEARGRKNLEKEEQALRNRAVENMGKHKKNRKRKYLIQEGTLGKGRRKISPKNTISKPLPSPLRAWHAKTYPR